MSQNIKPNYIFCDFVPLESSSDVIESVEFFLHILNSLSAFIIYECG
jgi:hypothetical protein